MNPRETRTLKTRLATILDDQTRAAVEQTAKSIGIAPNTYRKILRDDWNQLARKTIEKVCDRFDLEISELFQLVSDNFWKWFEDANEYYILKSKLGGSDPGDVYQARDAKARSIVTNFLKDSFPTITAHEKTLDIRNEDEILEYLRGHNCIVVGGPKTNPLTEIVICRHFGAVPFDATQANRRKLPFRFVYPEGRHLGALAEPWNPRFGPRSTVGVCDGKAQRLIAVVDWLPERDYFQYTTGEGRDAGVVLVISKPFATKKNVKTIVLSGFGRMGTEAAAQTVTRDFRELEPLPNARHVLGIREAIFEKLIADKDMKTLIDHRWKYLEGATGRKVRQKTEPTVGKSRKANARRRAKRS